MKFKDIKIVLLAVLLLGSSVSCEEFLDRPAEDNFTIDTFYKNDEQVFQAVNPIYNSPWYDFQRGFINVGDVLAGNFSTDQNGDFGNFTLKNSDPILASMSASLWAVNANCNGVIQNVELKSEPSVSQTVKNTVTGEAMVWKAMAYFYLVRCFGAVPIIHDNISIIVSNTSTSVKRNKIDDVYKYITLVLKDAIQLLPEQNLPGRIDRYSAYGLLAKVYLTKSGYGMNGTRNQEDLDEAAKYAKIVIDQSGRSLEPEYSEIFQLKGNFSRESLIAWQWAVTSEWTSQNSLQSDLSLTNFSDAVQSWGSYAYITLDLQEQFGESATRLERQNRDTRRKATMMMFGDKYDYLWTEMGGFIYNWDNTEGGMYGGVVNFSSQTGANCAKHIVGRLADVKLQGSFSLDRMHTPLSTHILRLADVYLVYAEAILGNNSSTSDPDALAAFNAVRTRALKTDQENVSSFNFDDIFKERRLELAMEGDNWYDLVRLHYYNPEGAKKRITDQERGGLEGLTDFYTQNNADNLKPSSHKVSGLTDSDFTIPFPEVDLSLNPGLMNEPVAFDFSSIGY